jgi:hypothetical protein
MKKRGGLPHGGLTLFYCLLTYLQLALLFVASSIAAEECDATVAQ